MANYLHTLAEVFHAYETDRIPQEAEPRDEGSGGPLLRQATDICRRSISASGAHKIPEFAHFPDRKSRQIGRHQAGKLIRPIEQEALYKWAKAESLILDNATFTRLWRDGGKQGETENQCYFQPGDDPANGRWYKRNDLSYHTTYLDFFYRMAMHNHLFPEAPLKLEGFVISRGIDNMLMLKPVISQAHVIADKPGYRPNVETHMRTLGFERVRNDDYFNKKLGIWAEDLHDENVLEGRDGKLYIIDPVIYMDDDGKAHRIKKGAALTPQAFAEALSLR